MYGDKSKCDQEKDQLEYTKQQGIRGLKYETDSWTNQSWFPCYENLNKMILWHEWSPHCLCQYRIDCPHSSDLSSLLKKSLHPGWTPLLNLILNKYSNQPTNIGIKINPDDKMCIVNIL